ncbi:MraY family glycosyltransferase [Thauera mechernichensis]
MFTVLSFLLSVCTTVCVLAALERVAPMLGLLDHPSGHKAHKAPTPVVGGIAIVLVLFAFALMTDGAAVSPWLYGGMAASALLGLVDDVRPLGAKTKLALMLVIFSVTLQGSGTMLVSLGELWPGVTADLGVLSIPFTLFAAVGVINAFNLIDGMDGLAGTVALCALSGFLLIAHLAGASAWVPFLVVIIAATAAFLAFNLRLPGRAQARLFLGDAGSLVLGLILFWLAVDLSQGPAGVEAIVMVWLLALPMLDTVATILLRLREGKSPLSPGHDHFHHLLTAYGASVGGITLLAGLLTVGFGMTGILMWLSGVPEWLSMSLFLVVTAAYLKLHLGAWSKHGRGQRLRGQAEP